MGFLVDWGCEVAMHECNACGRMCDCDGEDHMQPAPPDCECELEDYENAGDDDYDGFDDLFTSD